MKVNCRVRNSDCISPAGTVESPMSYVSSYCLFRTKDRPRIVQPSHRDFGYFLPNPPLERVGYSRISSPGDVSRKPHRLQQHTARKCQNSRHPSGVSFQARPRKWFHGHPLKRPSAPYVKVSLHTAQAFQRTYCARVRARRSTRKAILFLSCSERPALAVFAMEQFARRL